ncbi:hypothetical protein ID866_2452 [Astraeus odoratus]|nr:hypothetical protein ID866_2452 [Astraeus odoratus]
MTGRRSPTLDPFSTTSSSHPGMQGRQWSLFGQLLENEQQLRSPESYDPIRRHRDLSRQRSWASSAVDLPTPAAGPSELLHHPHIDDVSDSDTEDLDTSTPHGATTSSRWSLIPMLLPSIPVVWKNILKCSVAYFFASIFTLHPYLSEFFGDLTSYGSDENGPSPSGHMIATIAVYYNPAKTIGGMLEADTFCFIAWLYSAFVCLTGMSLFWWFDSQGWKGVEDLVPILWVGFSMWGLSWMKVWMSKPTFNSACNMAATVLFVVIVKEGGLGTFLQVSSIVLVGTVISNLVCFSLWPQSATDNLQANMTKTLDSFSTLLGMITSTFLLEEPIRKPSQEKIQKAAESHQATFTGLKKAFAEARSERFMRLDDAASTLSKQAYEDAVDSLTRLAQHLNGLRSGTRLQYELTRAQSEGKLVLRRASAHNSCASPAGRRAAVASLGEDMDEALLQAAVDMFGDLADDIGPHLRELSSTCTGCLKRLREAFVRSQGTQGQGEMMQPRDFHTITDSIERALSTFEETSNHALLRLYRRSNFSPSSRKSVTSALDDERLRINQNEHVFIVYFFIFTLQEFAVELLCLIDAMRRIYAVELSRISKRSWWQRYLVDGPKSIFSYLQSFRRRSPSEKRGSAATYFSGHRHPKVSFPKVRPHAPNTVQTPDRSNLTFIGRVKRSVWDLGDRLKDRTIKYAFKVGMSTAMLAAPAFFDATRPIFTEYRGEWALVSFFVVMSPTIGATNFMSVHRVLGTLIGAVAAAGIYSLFPHNPVVLSIFGFFFSIPCFYYIVVKPEYATSGRFVLLTYNLTCLYSFTNVRRNFILPVNKERRDMVGNIILYFSVLASAFRLKAPLPPYLPPAEEARESLVDAIRQLDVVKNREANASRQLLFFAYALTMKGVTQELDSLGRTLQDAFGVIGQSAEEFDALFMDLERNENGSPV